MADAINTQAVRRIMPTPRLALASLHVAAIPFLLGLALGTPAASQDLTGFPEPKTAEEYAEEAREAENSPLFASDEPLVITLRTDIEWIRDTRNDSVEVDGTIWFPGEDGAVLETPVEVRARGGGWDRPLW